MKRKLSTVASGLEIILLSFLLPSPAYAQSGNGSGGASCLSIFIILAVINIAILVWVIKDAQSRGASAGAWLVIVLLFGILGLLAYLVARPKGKLVPCPECGKQKPITDAICPHCGRRVV